MADEIKEVETGTEQESINEQEAFGKENQQPVSEKTKSYMEMAQDVLAEVNKVILGKKGEVAEIMTAFLADGHVLLEDIPGVGMVKQRLHWRFREQWDLTVSVCSLPLTFCRQT